MKLKDFSYFFIFKPIYVVIEKDDETKKVQGSIASGIEANASTLMSYLSVWDR